MLHEGRPFVTATGAVELWHRDCFDHRADPIASPSTIVTVFASPPSRMPRVIALAVAASALAGLGFAHWRLGRGTPIAASYANVELAALPPTAPITSTVSEVAPPRPLHIDTQLEARYPMPTLDGDDLDSVYPSLRGWIHPVTSSAELMPELHARHFGVGRAGVEGRPECGAGHCGIDLDGPRGRPLVSVADGLVVRVERAELGADGKSGRYVRIQHEDGTLTAYMHMDDVADDLQVGNKIFAGQYVGTLGATAVGNTPPHLHFSLELPNKLGDKGDIRDTHYIDPAPFLVRATIVKSAERRHAVKPAF
jgi:murein DD-endopeptidase MepM/ murein hydrolase activator NlpD